MSTVSEIVTALAARLALLPDVDQSDLNSYLPPVKTQKCALVIPPFEQETLVQAMTPPRNVLVQSHRIRCEFWCKLNTGDLPATIMRAREIGLAAIRLLIADQSLGGVVQSVGHFGLGSNRLEMTANVASVPVDIAGSRDHRSDGGGKCDRFC